MQEFKSVNDIFKLLTINADTFNRYAPHWYPRKDTQIKRLISGAFNWGETDEGHAYWEHKHLIYAIFLEENPEMKSLLVGDLSEELPTRLMREETTFLKDSFESFNQDEI